MYLILAALAAMLWANSPFAEAYEAKEAFLTSASNLVLPVVSTTPGPTYATQQNTALTLVDALAVLQVEPDDLAARAVVVARVKEIKAR